MAEDQNRTYDSQYLLRLPSGMRDRIKAAAAGNNRSMNAEIVATLEEKYPSPQKDLELSTLASWLDYVETGGPDEEFDDRLFEINDRLGKHQATKHLRLSLLVNGESEDMTANVILMRRHPEDDGR
ncbi:Arc family DNA-binding protein [Tritonibacter scottomollicae]|uniref:Arc family DNA-binding protein n=1 Tax=Tritonibacter scottomollicae TaxID=483013 RepID=UPI003AA7ED33